MNYEIVCGIETHIELATKTKIFCGCTTEFGGEPNTHCCPVCTGQPGQKVVEYAIKAGLALNCKINTKSHMDRKNYVYPDLPKAYQISQYDEPLCEKGYIELDSGKRIGITRIHIEEDAGKLVHENGYTYIDYNRSGVPLIEIVLIFLPPKRQGSMPKSCNLSCAISAYRTARCRKVPCAAMSIFHCESPVIPVSA